MATGIIYILTNDAMPNIIKIGQTTNLKQRLASLDTTGVPLPFRMHYAIEIEDYDKKEKFIHDAFANNRMRKNREFFELAPERAVSALKAIGGKEILTLDNEMIDSDGNVFADTPQHNREILAPFTFEKANIPIGAEIVFTRDETMVAKVVSNKKVDYNGEEYTTTSLTRKLMTELGYSNSRYAGPQYFTYDGEILAERRRRLENEDTSEDED